MTTSEPALPRPLAEAGTIRRLGAEVLEYPLAPGDAIVGARVRDLGLPRDAVVNVIVRGDQAIPPRGSTRLRAGDQLHVLLRAGGRAADPRAARPLARTARSARRRGRRARRRAARRSSARGAGREDDGDPARPTRVRGQPVVEQLRIRRDEPGGLWALEDGRYAVTGPVAAIGGARRAVRTGRAGASPRAEPDERAWLQTVIGALAADVPE